MSDITESLNEIDAMMWRVLRQATVRALVHPERTAIQVPQAEQERLLEPFTAALMHDCAMLREGLRQMYVLGASKVAEDLHGQPGVDDMALDEAVEFHSHPRDDDGEGMK